MDGADFMKLSPSLFAADPLQLQAAISALEACIESWHFDVMDGRFAPAHGLNEVLFLALQRASTRPIDVHIMAFEPAESALRFARMGARLVAVHGETLADPGAVLDAIRDAGALAYLAYTPETPAEDITRHAEAADGLLLLTAPQGGGAFCAPALDRLRQLPKPLPKLVDGGIGPDHFRLCSEVGVDTAVIGRSLFEHADLKRRMDLLLLLSSASFKA